VIFIYQSIGEMRPAAAPTDPSDSPGLDNSRSSDFEEAPSRLDHGKPPRPSFVSVTVVSPALAMQESTAADSRQWCLHQSPGLDTRPTKLRRITGQSWKLKSTVGRSSPETGGTDQDSLTRGPS